MKFKYQLYFTQAFLRKVKKLYKKTPSIKKQIDRIFYLMQSDPFAPQLKTHKVLDRFGKPAYSSRVNGDLRVTWTIQDDVPKILNIFSIGGHSGSKKIYK